MEHQRTSGQGRHVCPSDVNRRIIKASFQKFESNKLPHGGVDESCRDGTKTPDTSIGCSSNLPHTHDQAMGTHYVTHIECVHPTPAIAHSTLLSFIPSNTQMASKDAEKL
eukprot:1311501-Amphidinium_carterae.2